VKTQWVFYVVLALLTGLAAWMLLPFLAPVVMASVAGYLLMPVFDLLGRWIKSRPLRAVLLMMLVLFAIVLPVVLGLARIGHQIRSQLQEDNLIDSVAKFNDSLDRALGRHIPLAENFAEYTEKIRTSTLHAAPEIIGTVGTTAIDLVIFLYVLFFVLLDGREVLADLVVLIPLDKTVKPHLVHNIEATMTGVLYGQVMTAVAQAVLGGIGYAVVGVKHALLWTLLTLIAAMLPVAGGALIWVPVAVSRLLAGDSIGGWGLIIYMGVLVSIVDHILKPKLISGRAPLHPLAALLGVLGGLHFFGITGFLIGPVLLGLLSAMLRFYREMQEPALIQTTQT